MRSFILGTLLALNMILVLPSIGSAQACPGSPGCIDATFGTGGVSTVSAPNQTGPPSTVVQTDGKIVTVSRGGSLYGYVAIRLNTDGTPDPAFGTNGTVRYFWPGNPNSVALQDAGTYQRILIAGTATISAGKRSLSNRLRIDALRENGSLDTSWGKNGVVELDVNSAFVITVQPDQKIIVASVFGTITRLNADGTPDASFGSRGSITGGDTRGVILDDSGRILTCVQLQSGSGKNVKRFMGIKRFLPNGATDTSFGSGGTVVGYQTTVIQCDMSIDVVGNILLAGTYVAPSSSGDLWVQRYTANGLSDPSFAGGTVTMDFGSGYDIAAGVSAEPDGTVVLGATAGTKMEVARLNYDGSLDQTFGNNGKTVYNAGIMSPSPGMAMQTDPACACRKIIIIGIGPGTSGYSIFGRFIH